MSTPRYIFDIDPGSFAAMVMDNSRKGPVMVYYWSPNAGPCMRLMPRLVKLADDFGGRFLLTLMNTDDHKNFAQQQGVMSIPTVRVYYHEKLSETVRGSYSEQLFRQVIEKYLPRTAGHIHTEAARAYGSSTMEKCLSLMKQAAQAAPDDYRLALDQAKLLVQQGHYVEAAELLGPLPEDARQDPEIDLLTTHLQFVRTARQAPALEALRDRLAQQPDDLEVRYQLSAQLLMQDDYEQALEHLYRIVTEDTPPLTERAHRGMLAVLAMLGPDHPLSKRYQNALRLQAH